MSAPTLRPIPSFRECSHGWPHDGPSTVPRTQDHPDEAHRDEGREAGPDPSDAPTPRQRGEVQRGEGADCGDEGDGPEEGAVSGADEHSVQGEDDSRQRKHADEPWPEEMHL